MQYLVTGSGGPEPASPEEAVEFLEKGILPTFDVLMKLEEDGKILAGGLPVGERAFIFFVEAASDEELNGMMRNIAAGGALQWQLTPLQSIAGRAAQEREIVEEFKQSM